MSMCNSPGPQWPPRIKAYDYTSVLSRSRWAWEYARRNQNYQKDWRTNQAGKLRPIHLKTGAKLTRLRRCFPQAEAWGLCTFRRPT